MKLNDVEQLFMASTDEQCKRFLKRNFRKLSKQNLLGHFYKLYAKKINATKTETKEDPYKFMFEPLLKGGDLDD